MKNEFLNLFKPLKRKIELNKYIKVLFVTESVALVILLFAIIYSKNRYLSPLVFIFIILLPFVISFVYTKFLNKLTIKDVILTADSFGYNERFITAYENLEKNENKIINDIQFDDAFSKAKNGNFNKKYCIVFPKKIAILLFLMIAINVFVGFTYEKVYDMESKFEKNLVNIDEAVDNIKKDDNINSVDKYTIGKELSKLDKKLRFSKDEKEALDVLEEAEKTFKSLEKDFKSNDVKSLSDFKNNYLNNSALKEKLENVDPSDTEKYLDALNEALSSLNAGDLENFLENLKSVSSSLSNSQLSEAIENYLKNIENGNFNSSNNGLSNLKDALNNAISSNNNLNTSFNSISKELSEAKNILQNVNVNPQNSNAQTSTTNNSLSQNNNSTNNSGQSTQGNMSSNGQGNGSGSGTMSGTGSGTGQGGQGRGTGHVEYEKIYTRDAKNYADYTEKINGQENENGETSFNEAYSIGENGNAVDYKSVISEYKKGALSEMNSEQLPYGLKSMVEEYFISLDS